MPIANHIVAELARLADRKSRMSIWYDSRGTRRHGPNGKVPDWRSTLDRFLASTMDEVRLFRASEFARETLELPAFEEVIPFREAVLRREAGADTAYEKQRDHSAHTINNWLLGWLLYEHSPKLRDAMDKAIDARSLGQHAKRTHVEAFGDVWCYASILHDIGYLFEGGIERLSWQTQHEMARRGSVLVNDFFGNRIWHEWKVHCAADRQLIRDCGYKFLQLPTDGALGGVVDGLQQLGGLTPLIADVNQTLPLGKGALSVSGTCVGAFELWREHYTHVGSHTMATRVDRTRDAFRSMAYRGLPKIGIRVIDHGVASGLLLLQLITMYYGARSALRSKQRSWTDVESKRSFIGDAGGVDYNPLFWWSGILWGTFATAFHNVQQTFKYDGKTPLKVDEDPIAYLGILVDTLQEWDRYMVRREAVLADEPALQGVDVPAVVNGGVLEIDLLNAKRRDKAIEDLDGALDDWRSFVRIV